MESETHSNFVLNSNMKLVIGLLMGFPLAVVYRKILYRRSPTLQHLFFTCLGLLMAFPIFGWGCLHSVLNIFLAYLLVKLGGPQTKMVVAMFVLNVAYLVSGYFYKILAAEQSGGYHVSWTTMHCVLCLRLTGLAWDYCDGNKDEEKKSQNGFSTALKNCPSLLEIAGYSYFFGGFLVGPQFPMKRYLALVNGNLIGKDDDKLSLSLSAGLKRLLAGTALLLVYAVCEPKISKEFLLTDEYFTLPFLLRLLFVVCCVRIFLLKYQAVWLVVEGACIVSGLGYNGRSPNGQLLWDACSNTKLMLFDTAYTFQQVVDAFNCTTNDWIFRYVFKRLRFLGNKALSHMISMTFLALWHGPQPGFFFCFLSEFVIVVVERQIFNLYNRLFGTPFEKLPLIIKLPLMAFGFCVRHIGFSFSTVGFMLKYAEPTHKVCLSLHYIVPVALCCWGVLYLSVINPLLGMQKRNLHASEKKMS